MIEQTIAELEARIDKAEGVRPESKAELLRLLATLRTEVGSLSQTHIEEAQRIVDFATVSTHEAMRENKNPRALDLSREGLQTSVADFEKTHPSLVQIVNRICETLANLGI